MNELPITEFPARHDSTKRVIVALDNMTLSEAVLLTVLIRSEAAGLKIGFELLCEDGAKGVMSALKPFGLPVFFDPKLHDIPNTASQTARKLVRRGAWIINMHCLGGPAMMDAIRKAVDEVWDQEQEALGLKRKPLLIGVTVLTSLNFEELQKIGLRTRQTADEMSDEEKAEFIRGLTLRLALLAKDSGLDGVVTSPQEVAKIRHHCGNDFTLITPGVRPKSSSADDQKRVATPAEAIQAGADWLVIGRPITGAEKPVEVLRTINQQVAEVLAQQGGAV